jgi:hypothetical protein
VRVLELPVGIVTPKFHNEPLGQLGWGFPQAGSVRPLPEPLSEYSRSGLQRKRAVNDLQSNSEKEHIQWERMLPAEFRAAFEALPVVFLPLGTVEWHGEHNALGLDSLKAHALCVNAARLAGGGVGASAALWRHGRTG